MINEKKTVSIKELVLLAVLMYLKFPVENIDFQIEGDKNRPTAYFQFEETPELKSTIKDFWNGQLSVEPNEFMFNIRKIKAQTDGAYKNPRGNFNNYSKKK